MRHVTYFEELLISGVQGASVKTITDYAHAMVFACGYDEDDDEDEDDDDVHDKNTDPAKEEINKQMGDDVTSATIRMSIVGKRILGRLLPLLLSSLQLTTSAEDNSILSSSSSSMAVDAATTIGQQSERKGGGGGGGGRRRGGGGGGGGRRRIVFLVDVQTTSNAVSNFSGESGTTHMAHGTRF